MVWKTCFEVRCVSRLNPGRESESVCPLCRWWVKVLFLKPQSELNSSLCHFPRTAVTLAITHIWGNLELNKVHFCSEFLSDPSFMCFELSLCDCPCQEVIKENSFSPPQKDVFFHTSASSLVLWWRRGQIPNAPGLVRKQAAKWDYSWSGWLTPVLKPDVGLALGFGDYRDHLAGNEGKLVVCKAGEGGSWTEMLPPRWCRGPERLTLATTRGFQKLMLLFQSTQVVLLQRVPVPPACFNRQPYRPVSCQAVRNHCLKKSRRWTKNTRI